MSRRTERAQRLYNEYNSYIDAMEPHVDAADAFRESGRRFKAASEETKAWRLFYEADRVIGKADRLMYREYKRSQNWRAMNEHRERLLYGARGVSDASRV